MKNSLIYGDYWLSNFCLQLGMGMDRWLGTVYVDAALVFGGNRALVTNCSTLELAQGVELPELTSKCAGSVV